MCAAMVKIVDMDEKVTLSTQLEGDVDGGAVILLNKFTVQPEDLDEFLKVFGATTKVMKQQPRFLSAQLYCCIGVLLAVRSSLTMLFLKCAEHFEQPFNSSEFSRGSLPSPSVP